jgi:hypothetical protein
VHNDNRPLKFSQVAPGFFINITNNIITNDIYRLEVVGMHFTRVRITLLQHFWMYGRPSGSWEVATRSVSQFSSAFPSGR